MPNDVLEGLEKGAGENEWQVKLSFKDPDLIPALKFVQNEEVRKKIFIGNENKVSHWYFPPFPSTIPMLNWTMLTCKQYNANVLLFQEIVILRDEAARMLGYPDHASFEIEKRLAKTPKTVLDFLGDLRTQLTPRGAKETEYLKDLKKEHLKSRRLEASCDGNYYLWDHRFYDHLMVENEYSIDEQNVAKYFPL